MSVEIINTTANYDDGVLGERIFGGGQDGILLRLNEAGDTWDQVAPAPALGSSSQEISALCVYDNGAGDKLYGLISWEDGSSASCITLVEWNGTNAWVVMATLAAGTPAGHTYQGIAMSVYDVPAGGDPSGLALFIVGDHYDGASNKAALFKWDGDATLDIMAESTSYSCRMAIAIMDTYLYSAGDDGALLRWEYDNDDPSTAWEEIVAVSGDLAIYALAVHGGSLFCGGYGDVGVELYRLNDDGDAWEKVADQFGDEEVVNCLVDLGGVLLGGTYPHGLLLRWNEADAWEQVAGQSGSTEWLSQFSVMDGVLYCGANTDSGVGGQLLKWIPPTVGVPEWLPEQPGSFEIDVSAIDDLGYAPGSVIRTDATIFENDLGVFAALKLTYYENGEVVPGYIMALSDDETRMFCVALALEVGTGTKRILLKGIVRNDTWDWNPGDPVYVEYGSGGGEGKLTQIEPGAGCYIQIVGYAQDWNILDFNPQLPMVKVKAPA